MKNNLLLCFFFVISICFAQSEREIISQIDLINTKALEYYNNNDVVESYNTFTQALKLADSINDNYGSAVANFNLGRIYTYMREYENSEKSFTNMLNGALKINDNYLIANSYLGLAKLYDKENLRAKVIPNYELALSFALNNDVTDQNNLDKQNSLLFTISMDLFHVYLERGNIEQAFIYLLRAENNLKHLPENNFQAANFNYAYGLYFMDKKMYSKANEKFESALNNLYTIWDANLDKNLMFSKVYKELSNCYFMLEENEKAYRTLTIHNTYRDKFINEEKIRQEHIAKSKFSLAQYKQIADRANSEKLIQEQITQKVKNINVAIILTSLVLMFSLIMLYRNYVAKRKISQILTLQNEQLEIAKNQAEHSSKLKTKFISNVTHELRTPLYGVVGLTSLLLRKNDLSTQDAKYLKSLKYSGDYLLNLVNDILQIGKMESKKVTLKQVTVNLREFMNNITDSFQYKLQETNNKIHLTIDDGIPQHIKCDSVRLSQVLINLIGNSIKFTENETTRVHIKHVNTIGDKVKIEFIVKDNGPGIPKDKQQAIFDNFSQLDEDFNVNYKGTGLGLPITKKLLSLFGSEIKLESEVGEGATFSFVIDFEIDTDFEIEEIEEQEAKTVPLNSTFRILVAEDNKINQIVTQNILEKGNFICEIAKNGQEALDMLSENHYDLILMDINMPVMDGNEATKVIRKTNSSLPIIALTAADIEEVKRDSASIGYNDVITKPFDNTYFYQTILSHIQQSKSSYDNNSPLSKVS